MPFGIKLADSRIRLTKRFQAGLGPRLEDQPNLLLPSEAARHPQVGAGFMFRQDAS